MLTRLFTVVVTLLAFLHTFALAAPLKKTYALPKPIYYPFNAVHFRSTYSSIPPDTKIELAWEGGSGNGYEVYYIPQWADEENYYPVDIATTSLRSVKWQTPKRDAFPEGTTFIVGVKDVTVGPGSDWYDLTGLVKFGEN
ncbi:MAG: hypothetical protein TREMPRED_005708 [Tremellales sp. Tagirdzhanova-0007]|nr:MAG: hypothetical protein TREMPRED_005708 [Tremellales sp. Tagirdzhanova-0007]